MNKTYTIKDIEALTNIKAHTIRIWEQRYNIVHPDRTEGNSRRYSDEQLKKIMNIAFLNKRGIKISHIAMLSTDQILDKVNMYNQQHATKNDMVNQLISAVIHQDDLLLESTFDKAIRDTGFELTMNNIIKPLMNQIGLLWQTGTIDTTQEHFLSNYIKNRIIVETYNLPKPNKKYTFTLFLPNDELHELGLLFYTYVLRKMGFNVIYLGQAVPLEDLLTYEKLRNFDILICTKTSFILEENLQKLVTSLGEHFSKKIVLFSGFQFLDKKIQFPANTKYFKDSEKLKQIVAHLQ